jgi:hypothetical protein
LETDRRASVSDAVVVTVAWLRLSIPQDLEPDTYYIHIEDDVIFIQEGAIEQLVAEKLRGRWDYGLVGKTGRSDT